ncbi:MAG: DUF2273 domain-containing protein [Bacillota bacterium]|nr:DUF2273 domain-containing protein [Bacillota bacterium]
MPETNWWIFVSRHWGKILGALLGLIFALLVINYGFWISLFIFLCIAVGLLIGWRLDLTEDVGRFFRRFFSNSNE